MIASVRRPVIRLQIVDDNGDEAAGSSDITVFKPKSNTMNIENVFILRFLLGLYSGQIYTFLHRDLKIQNMVEASKSQKYTVKTQINRGNSTLPGHRTFLQTMILCRRQTTESGHVCCISFYHWDAWVPLGP